MNEEKYTDKMLIEYIRKGGTVREKALKYIFQNKNYYAIVKNVVVDGGGENKYVDAVFDSCLVQFDRLVRRFECNLTEVITTLFKKLAERYWGEELKSNDCIRDQIMAKINKDKQLKMQLQHAIFKNSGNYEDAQDCYQNGMIYLKNNLEEGKYRGGNIKGYFYQLCFNLWRNELKKIKPVSVEQEQLLYQESGKNPQHILEEKENAELLNKIFHQIGKPCQKILHLKYFVIDQFSMDEIAVKMEFKNAQNASNMLSKCRKKLWDLLKENEPDYSWKNIIQKG